MQGTISRQITIDIVQDYLLMGLGTFLIYKPELGLTDTPNPLEKSLRYEMTMEEAVNYEVGGPTLNGYKRDFIRTPFVLYMPDDPITKIRFDTYFLSIEKPMGPFTHICVAINLNTIGGGLTNGNNRGDTRGTLIGIKPVPTEELNDIIDRPDIENGTIGRVLYPRAVYTDEIYLELSFY